MTKDELREQVGGLLEQQVKLAQGLGGLMSADSACAIEHLACAYANLVDEDDE